MRIKTGRSSGSRLYDVSSADVTLTPSSFEYDGNPKTPTVMVELDGVVLRPNKDYSVRYFDNQSSGIASVRIDGIGSYDGSKTGTFAITVPEEPSTSLSNATVTLQYSETVFTGSALTPSVVVKMGQTTLTQGTNYSVSYADNTVRGTATVTVTGLSPYSGSKSATFKILSPTVESATVTLNAYVFNYTGSLVRPVPTVTLSVGGTSVLLVKDVDYDVSYSYTGARGTAYVIVTGKGQYRGTHRTSFQIGKDISTADVDIGASEYPYTGGAVRPWPTVTMSGVQLVDGVDYDLTYDDNVEIGVGRIVVTGKNDYAGSVTKLINVSNTENEAWENLTINNGMVQQTGYCFLPWGLFGPDSYGDPFDRSSDYKSDSSLKVMQPLPDGSVVLYLNVCRTYNWSANNPRFAKIRFESGHEFDFSGDSSGSPLYIKRDQSGVVYVELMNFNRDISFGTSVRDSRMPVFVDYGRKLILPGGRYSWGDSTGYSSPSGPVTVPGGDPGGMKSIIMADLPSPYSMNTKGCERLAYLTTLGGSGGYVEWVTMFSGDGKKFFFMDSGVPSYETSKMRVFNLKVPWELNGDSSVESESVVAVDFLPGRGSGYQTPRFSPDGRYCVTVNDTYNYHFVKKFRFSTPWDLSSSVLESQTTTPLVYIDENNQTQTFSKMPNSWIILPHYHRLVIAQYGSDGVHFRTFTI